MLQKKPSFSVVTPSYNMFPYLDACHHSVIDQDVAVEHIIIDGGSTDGTADWLTKNPDIRSVSERDEGMYDAINKGIMLSEGEIISYLNCDEQYLVGALKKVQNIFDKNPVIDILFGNTLIINPEGYLLAFRKGFSPRWPYIWSSYLYLHTSSMFVRKKIFDSGMYFDKSWKTIGDADFVVRVLKNKFKAMHIDSYLSAFIMTGSNLGGGSLAQEELKKFRQLAPQWLQNLTLITDSLIRVEKLFRGSYFEKMPLRYAIYPIENPTRRVSFEVLRSSPLYPDHS